MSEVDVCNRALALAGARATITALNDGSNEANNCNLIYAKVRDQILGMAPWNFTRKTAYLNLLKTQPGTPESYTQNANQWTPSFPPPGWLYEYAYPSDCVFMRFIVPQANAALGGVPIFSSQSYTYFPQGNFPMVFTPAQDLTWPFMPIFNITQTNPAVIVTDGAHGFSTGNIIWLTGATGTYQINNVVQPITVISPNSFSIPINATQYGAFTGGGTVVNFNGTEANRRVIFTSAPMAIGTYNKRVTDLDLWSEDAEQVLVNVLAAQLIIPLGGDKKLKGMALEEANIIISEARALDARESLVYQETVPDWIRIRDTFTYPDASPYYASWPALYPTKGLV